MAAFERHFVHFGASDSLPEVAVHRAVTTSTTVVRNHDLDGASTNKSTHRSVELDGWRYFTAMPCPSTEQPAQLCLFFKDKALDEAWVGAVTSEDGLHFTDEPALVMPQRTTFGKRNRQVRLLTHNLALTFHRGQYFAIGGQDNKKLGRVNRGLWLAQGAAWRYAAGRLGMPSLQVFIAFHSFSLLFIAFHCSLSLVIAFRDFSPLFIDPH